MRRRSQRRFTILGSRLRSHPRCTRGVGNTKFRQRRKTPIFRTPLAFMSRVAASRWMESKPDSTLNRFLLADDLQVHHLARGDNAVAQAMCVSSPPSLIARCMSSACKEVLILGVVD